MGRSGRFEAELARLVGSEHVLTDPDLLGSYTTDWTGRFVGRARAVVRPGSTPEVAGVVEACAEHDVPVVPQGGNTGLVGGASPRDAGQLVLSLRRLAELGEADVVAREVTAQAGVTVAALQREARSRGLRYGIDLASRESATVGGTVATNAGGLRVVRYGTTRAQVRGLELVLADGRVVDRLRAAPQDNAGLDLTGLIVGSEGTLAVITAARLRLVTSEPDGIVTMVGCQDVGEAIALLPASGLRAAEVMLQAGVDLVCAVGGLAPPLQHRHPAYLLLETADLPNLPDDVDAAVDPSLWAYREQHTEAISVLAAQRRQVVHKLDVSLPLDTLPAFVAELTGNVAPDDVHLFGHLAMGNLHVNVIGAGDDVDERLLRLVAAHGGSIAAEHGIGQAKTRWLHLSRSGTEIELMRSVKRAFDPAGLLNPGVLLPD